MSYNPAFVSGEPAGSSNSAAEVKLTSFKVLPGAGSGPNTAIRAAKSTKEVSLEMGDAEGNSASQLTGSQANRQQEKIKSTNQKHHHHHHDNQHNHNHNHNHHHHQHNHGQQQQQQHHNHNHHHHHHNQQTQPPQQQQQQSHHHTTNYNNNVCTSTSSSLSLIAAGDNPSLSMGSSTCSGPLIGPNQGLRSPTVTNCSASTATTTATSSASSTPPSTSPSIVSTASLTGLCAAVEIRDLRYDVGMGRKQKNILSDINVTVPEGSIYGLLGPSGCGKTTMLRCVVGRIKPKSGFVKVFGYHPNEPGAQIPGPAIGYMPQEISVYEDFTINETLIYFGKINKMRRDLIDARIEFLLNFLDLPGKNRLIASLSGGQKRRVSLAAALVHSPPLLILDEPTVGVDPLLRQSIWKHLVTLAQAEKITVVITTHYIEEARQANVVGLMRHGKLLAEDSPDNLMAQHRMVNLEDVFLKLCISDSSRRAAQLASSGFGAAVGGLGGSDNPGFVPLDDVMAPHQLTGISVAGGGRGRKGRGIELDANGLPVATDAQLVGPNDRIVAKKKKERSQFPSIFVLAEPEDQKGMDSVAGSQLASVAIVPRADLDDSSSFVQSSPSPTNTSNGSSGDDEGGGGRGAGSDDQDTGSGHPNTADSGAAMLRRRPAKGGQSKTDEIDSDRKSDQHQLVPASHQEDTGFIVNRNNLRSMVPGSKYARKRVSPGAWSKSLLAVTWKNYIRLKRNPPVLIFEFILPAVQVILFCLCIGGDPFDVPLAVVNDELIPQASKFFLDAIDKKAIRQVPYTNLSDAIESVRRGETWGAIHIPDRYTQFLQERLTHPAEISDDTLANGTINIYPDLTNLHLALAMENTFREAFIKFARDTLHMFGYDPEAAELPIKVEAPVYGTLKRNGYLEFMAPGVVISITYVMATGLTALAFILEKRDGLLERSLVSGVTTSQILLAHASVQVLVMVIQIALVLAFTFIVFEIPSNGPFFWVAFLILLQGCTGMAFGLLVSAVCEEENTAVMMLVGTFYTNLILAGIIWPLEAMPRWLRWFSYMQPQTLPTETLRNILSRGWGISETGVYVGFIVTIGWLVVFLLLAGLFMRCAK